MSNLPSIRLGNKDYALVPGRLKQFREDNPRSDVDTTPTYNPDGSVAFKATLIKDRADESSARATGNARYDEVEMKKPKSFEKLETIAVGRALANLGYLNNGEIATSEEMEEFENYKSEQRQISIDIAVQDIYKAADIESLRKVFTKLGSLIAEPEVVAAKDKKKKELTDENSKN